MSAETASDVGILGAGVSGILMGMQLRRAGLHDFIIHERLADVGGTWFRNTWPGLCCDVPSHLYSYSFAPNPDWSQLYADQAEIQRYLRACADRHDLPRQTRFSTTVESARFDEDTCTWLLEDSAGNRTRHRMVVSATGGLTEPNLPRIGDFEDYRGIYWHSGAWRHDVDLAGKRVAVVGSAASAVQVVPQVARRAAHLTVYQRSPNWMLPRNNRPYTDTERAAFAADPGVWRRHWRDLYRRSMLWHRVYSRIPRGVEELRRTCLDQMRAAIPDPARRALLTPDYEPGCKRILVSDDYYPAFALPHVDLVASGVTAMTPTGIASADGQRRDFDVVIFCTGYKLGGRADGRPAVEVYGRDGLRLANAIARRPEQYRGIATPGFPNWFTICGINGSAAYTSLFASAEIHAEFIARMAGRIIGGELRSIEPDADATTAYSAALQERLQRMSWAGDCTNFYKNRAGRILSFHPGTAGEMRRDLRSDDGSGWHVA
ncbi:MAG: NAD(P)/FAD-dependent oxidoreductase [Pseudomonadota bacterium]|nr:NAD(P)/FAD-dependent oxidoreductase [Pseudomonadota bacterium]